MKICVYGLWHLGCVTAACLAEAGFTVVALEDEEIAAERLRGGHAPLFEPGLDEVLQSCLASNTLSVTSEKQVVNDAELIWVTYDTPVDDNDRADVAIVIERICGLFPHLRNGAIVLVSSQLPVGTMAEIERRFAAVANGRRVAFAYSPENLRLGRAIEVFKHPERIVVGLRDDAAKRSIAEMLTPFSDNVIWVGTESAEVIKHAINAFLAASVTFANEIAVICEHVGADAREVERGLRSEPRIGERAYIRPGAAFAGGTLARDVMFLGDIARAHALPAGLLGSIVESNRAHARWPLRKLSDRFGDLRGLRVALLGLAYKPGTDTLRRSVAVELARDLAAAGAEVKAFDPAVREFPEPPRGFELCASPGEALAEAAALVVMTEWPQFKSLTADELVRGMARPVVIDPNGFLRDLACDPRIQFLTIGVPI
jgi:UDPglucose 6-dehydrogenase